MGINQQHSTTTTTTTPNNINMSTHTDKTKTGTGANIVQDAPLVKKDIVREHPEIVHKEHHVQLVIHEKERHIQPVHKTEVTAEHPVIHTETVAYDSARTEKTAGVGQKIMGAMKEATGA